MQPLQNQYDWIVLGQHPASLLTATQVARAGFSTLILPLSTIMEFHTTPTGQYFDPESNFHAGYLLNLVEDLTHSQFSKKGLSPSYQKSEMDPLKTSMPQILTPFARIDFSEAKYLPFEIQRELGKSFSEKLQWDQNLIKAETLFENFWKTFFEGLQLPRSLKSEFRKQYDQLQTEMPRLFRTKRRKSQIWPNPRQSVTDTIAQYSSDFRSQVMRETCDGLWFGLSSTLGSFSFFDLFHLMALSRKTANLSVLGGTTALRRFLVKMAVKSGVQFAENLECRRIFIEEGRFAGVQIGTSVHRSKSLPRGNAGGEMISGKMAILGTSMEKAAPLYQSIGKNRSLQNFTDNYPKPKGWKFTIALTVRKEALPPMPLRRMIWKEEGAPILEIEVTDPSEYQIESTDIKILYLRTVMPFDRSSLNSSYQKITAARMVRQGMEIFPFLNTHILKAYPEFRLGSSGVTSFNEFDRAYPFNSPHEIPDNLLIYGAEEGVGFQSGIQGLFVANDQSYPKLGSMGATVAALESLSKVLVD